MKLPKTIISFSNAHKIHGTEIRVDDLGGGVLVIVAGPHGARATHALTRGDARALAYALLAISENEPTKGIDR